MRIMHAARRLLGKSAVKAATPKWRGIEGLESRLLMATQLINNPGGPILGIAVGDNLDFQLWHTNAGVNRGQLYPSSITLAAAAPADAGFFLRTGGNAYGHTGGASAAAQATDYDFVSNTLSVVGSTYTVTTVVKSPTGAPAFEITQTTTYIAGQEYFRQDNVVRNTGNAPLNFDTFTAADIYLASSDYGYPYYNSAADAIGGEDQTHTYRIFNQPVMGALAPTSAQEAFYSTIWSVIGGGTTHFDGTTDPDYIDNGAGHEWRGQTLAAGASQTYSYYWAFGSLTAVGVNALTPDPTVAGALATPVLGTIEAPASTSISDLRVTINWGDNTGDSWGSLVPAGMSQTGNVIYNISAAAGPHVYRRPGTYTINFSVSSIAAGAQGSGTSTTIEVLPSTTTVGGKNFTVQANEQFTTVVGQVFDTNGWMEAGDFAAFIDWGDGTAPTEATLVRSTLQPNSPSGAVFNVFGTHTYDASTGVRTVHFEVYSKGTNDKLATGVSTAMVATQRLTTQAGQISGGTFKLLDADTGVVAKIITPFTGWTGDLNVATGDVTGDGTADFIVAPGVGGGPWIAIYDGATGTYLSMFAAFDPSDVKGYNIATGDTNGDGIADILVGEETGTRVRLFGGSDATVWWEFTPGGFYYERTKGTTEAFHTNPNTLNWNHPELVPDNDFIFYSGGVRVAMADLDGDGYSDVIVAPSAPRPGAGWWAAPVEYYNGRTSNRIHYYMPFGDTYTGGVKIAGGDFTNDGHADVALLTENKFNGIAPGAVFIHDLVGSTYQNYGFLPTGTQPKFDLGTTDYNLDGVQDLVITGLTTKRAKVTRIISGGTLLPIYSMN